MKEKEGLSKGIKLDEDRYNEKEDNDGQGDNPGKMSEGSTKKRSYEIEVEGGANTGRAENRNAPGKKFGEEENIQAQQYISACFCKQIKIQHYHQMDFFGEKLPMLGREQLCCVIFSFLPQK